MSNTVLSIKPSRAICLLLMVLFFVMIGNVANAQTASSTWTLTNNGNSANVGNVSGDKLTIGNGIEKPDYDNTTGVSTEKWKKDASSLLSDEYYEFKVTPSANTIFNIKAINFEHSISSGNWRVQAYYSTDGFVTSAPITTAFSSNSTTPTANNNTVDINIDNVTLSVRIYGWESDGNNRLRIKNVVISGTTCVKPVVPGTASAYSVTCSGFTAQWGNSNNTNAYFIDVATNNSFAPTTIVPAYNNVNVGNVLSLVLTGLNPGTTYYYRVRASNNCGTSSSSSTMNYTTSPYPTVAPVAKAASNIQCSYVQLNFSTGSNVTGVYLDIAKDNGFTDFLPGYNNFNLAYNNGSIPVDNLPAGTLYYRIRGYNSCGVTANSNTISFSTSSPIGGTVSPAQKICSGTSPANLTLTGYSTTNTEILKWQKSSVAVFSNPIDIAGTASTLSGTTIGNLTVDTYFRAMVRNKFGSWCESFSTPVLISIAPTPIVTSNKVNETCSSSNDGSISPTISGGLTNIRYIKLTQKYVNAAAYQQVAEIQAFEIFTGTNVALATNGTTAISSSNYIDDAANYGPQKAIDGDFIGYSFWHSKSTNINEYIKVDLQTAKNINYLRIYNRVDCCQERGQNMLLELFDGSNNLIYSKIINLYEGVNGSHYVDVNVLDVSWTDGTTTLNRTALDSGTYTLNYADALGCNAVNYPIIISAKNASPSTPTVGTPTQPNCKTPTGAITVTSPSPAAGITYTITGTNPVVASVTNKTGVFSGLAAGNYNVATTNGCTSSPTAVVINAFVENTNTWNGSAWSTGLPPTAEQKLVFAADYPPAVDPNVDIEGCSCLVSGNKTVKIKSGRTLTITNEVTVVGGVVGGGSLIFENNASLVQINNTAINSGDIEYQRSTNTVVRKTDYVYWSSPVFNQKLGDLSSKTANGTFYSFDTGIEDWSQKFNDAIMDIGKGYIVRRPDFISGVPVITETYTAYFEGQPNNGIITFSSGFTGAAEGTSNLLGNPYPSAIDADKFLAANAGVLDGTLYFWTHNTALNLAGNISNPGPGWAYTYSLDDYASYNITGGVGTAPDITASAPSDPGHPVLPNGVDTGKKPTGKIAAGQGFFATSKALGNVTFNNGMRLSSGGAILDNTQFFKTKNPNGKIVNTIEKNRVWLNLTNTLGAFKQTLIGYVTDATNEYDNRFDGESFDANEYLDFYSVYQDKNLVIQGRALPFDAADEVQLGYRTTINGEFTINIDQVDGLLANQAVFIEDKLTNTVFDLKSGNYTFTTIPGTFNDRFVLKYSNKTLSVDQTDKVDGILVFYSNNYNTLIIHNENMDSTVNSVSLFNMAGQNIGVWDVRNSEQTSIQIPIKKISSGIYIVKAKTTNGESSKKIIVN